MCVAETPGSVTFNTQEQCKSIIITWNALPAGPCPITDYMIDIGATTRSVGTGVTTFNYPFGDDSCGTTLRISVYAINPAGIGTKTFKNRPITCTGKGNIMHGCSDDGGTFM